MSAGIVTVLRRLRLVRSDPPPSGDAQILEFSPPGTGPRTPPDGSDAA